MIEDKKYLKGSIGWYIYLGEKYGYPNIEDVKKNLTIRSLDKWLSDKGILKDGIYKANKERLNRAIDRSDCKTLKEYHNKLAQKSGFKNSTEKIKKWRHETGRSIPIDDKECPLWFGDFTENLMIRRYPDAIKMPYNNKGFDYLWHDTKIDHKGRCLRYIKGKSPAWNFGILFNNSARKFVLSGWDNRESINPIYAWEFDGDDIVRGDSFWKRTGFYISNTPEGLKQFEDHQIDIDWLKELLRNNREV